MQGRSSSQDARHYPSVLSITLMEYFNGEGKLCWDQMNLHDQTIVSAICGNKRVPRITVPEVVVNEHNNWFENMRTIFE